jgi:glycosyltransferase involved in cell wall biosynthesis
VIRTLGPRVLERHPDTFYLIVGDGDDRPRLESLGVECAVAKNVQFAGSVPPEELPDYSVIIAANARNSGVSSKCFPFA